MEGSRKRRVVRLGWVWGSTVLEYSIIKGFVFIKCCREHGGGWLLMGADFYAILTLFIRLYAIIERFLILFIPFLREPMGKGSPIVIEPWLWITSKLPLAKEKESTKQRRSISVCTNIDFSVTCQLFRFWLKFLLCLWPPYLLLMVREPDWMGQDSGKKEGSKFRGNIQGWEKEMGNPSGLSLPCDTVQEIE